jgi:hypothetical protein
MILNLSRKTQRQAQATMLRYMTFNALGVSLTVGSVIALLALHYGAGDIAMGAIYAAAHVTGLAGLLGPMLLSGAETSRAMAKAWRTRAWISAAYLLLVFVPQGHWKLAALIPLYYSFLTARAIGINSYFSIMRAICPSRTMQSFTARIQVRHSLWMLVASIFAFVILELGSGEAEEKSFLVIIAVGVLMNMGAYRVLYQLPKTGYITEGSLSGLWRGVRKTFVETRLREVAWLVLLSTVQVVSVLYLTNYLKLVAGYSSATVFLITCAGVVGSIVGGQALKIIGDRMPFRPILFSTHLFLTVMGLLWTFVDAIPWFRSLLAHSILYAVTIMGLSMSQNIIQRLQANRMPQEHNYQVAMMYQIISVVGALFAVGFIRMSSDMFSAFTAVSFHPYSNAFTLWSIVSLVICAFSIVVRVGRTLRLAHDFSDLSPANLLTLVRVYQAEQLPRMEDRQLRIEGVLQNPTPTSQQMVVEAVHSSDVSERYFAYRMLNRNPLPEAYDTVLAEADAVESPIRSHAITTLGYLGNRAAVPDLQRYLDDEAALVRATAAKSLMRLYALTEVQAISAIYEGCPTTESRFHILSGLSSVKNRNCLLKLLEWELRRRPDPYWTRTIFNHVSQAFDLRESMTEIFNAEQLQPGGGLDYILKETEPPILPEGADAMLRKQFEDETYANLPDALIGENPEPLFGLAYDRYSFIGLLFLWTEMKEAALRKTAA